ncbi:ferrochelatase [Catellatospora tritici]|uniref:ferrochelatase n=1 Tax=Catellatospora tritici TaxID=2851566 RepID=UPI001C2DBC27|nr:ferrochelatase [Catellatospora tritici]MBV1852271.1 ferrochelatase [Catellatospora tritici]
MYDGFLLLSFGGPEHPDEVLPFLHNVTRGRGVPPERLAEVAEHYQRFGGVSPINAQCRELVAAVRGDFAANGVDLPVYWGNRNWRPMLADTLAQMRDHGIQRAIALATSGYGSYSSCRQYLQDIAAARAAVGPRAPMVDKLRHFHDHPGYVEPFADAVASALASLDVSAHDTTRLVFTAHSIPVSMAESSGPTGGRYEAQLRETAGLVAERGAPGLAWDLVWQSRSGAPHIPWLEPDVNEHLKVLAKEGVTQVVVSPIGFVSDHLEVLWDLDEEAAATARQLGLGFARAGTPGADPRFVAMVRDLVRERMEPGTHRRAALGTLGHWDVCPSHCCPPPVRGSREVTR